MDDPIIETQSKYVHDTVYRIAGEDVEIGTISKTLFPGIEDIPVTRMLSQHPTLYNIEDKFAEHVRNKSFTDTHRMIKEFVRYINDHNQDLAILKYYDRGLTALIRRAKSRKCTPKEL